MVHNCHHEVDKRHIFHGRNFDVIEKYHIKQVAYIWKNYDQTIYINHLTPNVHFSGRTAPLTYRC
jgi:hypothetical protein